MQARAAVSASLGDLQVCLLRELAARLEAWEDGTRRASVRVEARTDQLEAAVREMRRVLDAAANSSRPA